MVYFCIMIADTLDKLSSYIASKDGRLISDFLANLTPGITEGRHQIKGDDIFASISSYETKPRVGAYPEAHRRYADIQLLLTGQETIEWFPAQGMSERVPYDAARDIEFFERPPAPDGSVTLRPGLFAIFMPPDAHMPQLRTGAGAVPVIKVVIKVLATLITSKED